MSSANWAWADSEASVSFTAFAALLLCSAVFALSLKAAGFAQADVQQLFMFQTLRDQISAAVRLGVIGSMEATRRQLSLYPQCGRLLAETAGRPYAQATRCAPQIDIAQSVHDELYSRLFQS